ncbi:hypothetical protein BBP40_000681 [Aspergillus hancockii]|nr:hypothetical protein BBP40_000681 [Aspergillus hancockii]
MHPASPAFYQGVILDDEIHSESIGGTWYPTRWEATDTELESRPEGRLIILHLHGGAYILGDGRSTSHNFLNRPARQNTVQPSPLQDAITAYTCLFHTLCLPAWRIVLSGDNAGGHLALALLRYISNTNNPHLLPAQNVPGFSPPGVTSPQRQTQPNGPPHGEPIERYVAPIRPPFVLPSPVLVVHGGREVLYQDHEILVRKFHKVAQNGFRIELFVEPQVPHDVLFIVWMHGFRIRQNGVP